MTKHDWIWVAIKVLGLYLLVEAIIAIPGLIGSAHGVYQHYGFPPASSVELDRISRLLHEGLETQFISSLFRVIICAAGSFYFLRRGRFLFRLACPPESDNIEKT